VTAGSGEARALPFAMHRRAAWVAVAVLIVVVLAAQGLADSATPFAGRAAPGSLLGRAGFAYLTGIRVFIAAVLWSRMEPIEHTYYEGRSLKDETWAVPATYMVIALDPQFVQPYYVMPWILLRRGKIGLGLALARQGVVNNPESGLLHAAYASNLATWGHDMPGALRQARLALGAQWVDVQDKFDGYNNLVLVYDRARDTATRDRLAREVKRLAAYPPSQPIVNGRP
jgi:hypothetical protein